MTNNIDKKHFGIGAIEEFTKGLSRDFKIISESNKGAASRLVWFVAIAGFGFLNIRTFAETALNAELCKTQLILLSLPWALTAVVGIVSHWLLGELIARDNNYYILKQHAIRAFLATARKEPSLEEVLSILNVDDTDNEVKEKKELVAQLHPWVTRAERITFALLLFAFAWSVAFPLFID